MSFSLQPTPTGPCQGELALVFTLVHVQLGELVQEADIYSFDEIWLCFSSFKLILKRNLAKASEAISS